MEQASQPAASQVKPVKLVTMRKAYKVPRHGAPMDLFLDGNEGKAPDASLYAALIAEGIGAAARYPSAAKLETHLAEHWQISPAQALVTAGADDAIDRISRVMLAEGKEMIFPTPSFEMMARYGEVAGGQIQRVSWPVGTPYPLQEVLAKIGPQTGIIAVISPNNPTGTTTPLDVVYQLAEAAPHAVILFDLAYVEFADEDPTQAALTMPNVLVTRTLSKAWGLAGLRIGYALAAPQIIEWMRVAGEPYAVAGPSLVLAEARLRHHTDEVHGFIQQVRKERSQLEAQLASLDLEVNPSQGNFVFAKGTHERTGWLKDALAGLGIAIRTFPGNAALKGYTRITCPGDPTIFARLTHAVESALAPDVILFDMDGVLVDVGNSYREAIIQSAAHFGAAVTKADITAAKAAGNANNDWILTHTLLEQAGITVDLADVTAQFERLYQGTPDQPGLRNNETLIVDREWLLACREIAPLGIVTGRPRHDARLLLERFGLLDLFDAIVCMEDAPAKPDPAPVQLALSQMNANHAWMIGDTPDDIRAARRASVIPIGVAPPGACQDTTAQSLIKAGAAISLSHTRQLLDYLVCATQPGELP